MENVIHTIRRIPTFLRDRTEEKTQSQQRAQLLAEIRSVNRQLHCAQARFDQICDNDLLDACIYEIDALYARYRYLLTQARTCGITETPFAVQPADSPT